MATVKIYHTRAITCTQASIFGTGHDVAFSLLMQCSCGFIKATGYLGVVWRKNKYTHTKRYKKNQGSGFQMRGGTRWTSSRLQLFSPGSTSRTFNWTTAEEVFRCGNKIVYVETAY